MVGEALGPFVQRKRGSHPSSFLGLGQGGWILSLEKPAVEVYGDLLQLVPAGARSCPLREKGQDRSARLDRLAGGRNIRERGHAGERPGRLQDRCPGSVFRKDEG